MDMNQKDKNRLSKIRYLFGEYSKKAGQLADMKDEWHELGERIELESDKVYALETKAKVAFVRFFFSQFDPSTFVWTSANDTSVTMKGFKLSGDWIANLYESYCMAIASDPINGDLRNGSLKIFTDPMDAKRPAYIVIRRRNFAEGYRFNIEFIFPDKKWYKSYIAHTGIEVK